MIDQEKREKVIKGLECCAKDRCEVCPYYEPCHSDEFSLCAPLAKDALKLLKAQEPVYQTWREWFTKMGLYHDTLTANANVNDVDAVPVVRCKDCKHRPIDRREESVAYYAEMKGVGLEFPDDHCPCQCGDRWYSWYPSDDWYCAEGERRDDDANLS